MRHTQHRHAHPLATRNDKRTPRTQRNVHSDRTNRHADTNARGHTSTHTHRHTTSQFYTYTHTRRQTHTYTDRPNTHRHTDSTQTDTQIAHTDQILAQTPSDARTSLTGSTDTHHQTDTQTHDTRARTHTQTGTQADARSTDTESRYYC